MLLSSRRGEKEIGPQSDVDVSTMLRRYVSSERRGEPKFASVDRIDRKSERERRRMLWTMGGGGGKAKSDTGVKERESGRDLESRGQSVSGARVSANSGSFSPRLFFRLFLLSFFPLLVSSPTTRRRFSVVAQTNEIPG